ncbi:hypothetical protein EHS17_14355 [Rhodobacteraceae bacterium CH30]|nr:hypothetical protein EHS17_14355 [Rhodobacteraceae bacterium CH30]
MKIILPTSRPEYLPVALWGCYLSDAQHSQEPTLTYCQRLLFGPYAQDMFMSMQSKNGGIAKLWTNSEWKDWLLFASTTATRVAEKDYAEILRRRKLVLDAIKDMAGNLLSMMDEAMDLMMADGVAMPDRAVGMDKNSPPQERALFNEVRELFFDVQYEQNLPVADWLISRDRRLSKVVNNEPRLRYVTTFLECTKGCTVKVSDRVMAYQCAALYGLSDQSGDELDKLLQSITKARRAHEKRMKEPSYCFVYFGPPEEGPPIRHYVPFSGYAAFSYWMINFVKRNRGKSARQK